MRPHQDVYSRVTPDAVSLKDLSPREAEVLGLITNGLSNTEIASTMFLGINTVKTYIRTLYRKIGVTTRTQAVLWGVHHDLLNGYKVVPRRSTDSATLRAV